METREPRYYDLPEQSFDTIIEAVERMDYVDIIRACKISRKWREICSNEVVKRILERKKSEDLLFAARYIVHAEIQAIITMSIVSDSFISKGVTFEFLSYDMREEISIEEYLNNLLDRISGWSSAPFRSLISLKNGFLQPSTVNKGFVNIVFGHRNLTFSLKETVLVRALEEIIDMIDRNITGDLLIFRDGRAVTIETDFYYLY